ncbi:MAG TPA: hypothetical protein VE082_04705 [Desulfobaccales bacterium]|nr:hypothetical protein [Desulfobaccales bacterium]
MVAAFVESPLYFTMPLQQRLELMKQVEQKSYFCDLRRDLLLWIKTGILKKNSAAGLSPPDGPAETD